MKRNNNANTADMSKTMKLALMGMFSAIIIILAFTPFGYIQLPFIKATIIHIPVIIGALILGPKYGAVLGFLFGVTSLINNTVAPAVSSFAFSPLLPLPGSESGSPLALIICFVPRILVGVLPWFVYVGLRRLIKQKLDAVSFVAAGVAGSLTNTLLVMHLIFLLFKDAYAAAKEISIDAVYPLVLSVIAANGIPEAITAGIITGSVCGVAAVVLRKRGG